MVSYSPNSTELTRAKEEEINNSFNNVSYFGNEGLFWNGLDYMKSSDRKLWWSESLTGQAVQGAINYLTDNEESSKEFFIHRNAALLDASRINNTIEDMFDLQEDRGLNKEEAKNLTSLIAKRDSIEKDLAYVYENKDGDLDAPIDSENKSFNQRWGLDSEDIKLGSIVSAIVKDPKYMGTILFRELIRDLPLMVFASAGLATSAYKGTRIAKTIEKINNIESTALRGVGKLGVGVAVGGLVGGAYESSYELMNEHKLTGASLKRGTEFGAAFGALNVFGTFKKTPAQKALKEAEASQKVKTEEPSTPLEEVYAEISAHLGVKAKDDVENLANNLNNNPHQLFEKDLNLTTKEGITEVDYELITREQALKRKVIDTDDTSIKNKEGITTVFSKDRAYVIFDDADLSKTHNSFLKKKKTDKLLRSQLAQLNHNQLSFIYNPKLFKTFAITNELSKILQVKNRSKFESRLKNLETEIPFEKMEPLLREAFPNFDEAGLRKVYLGSLKEVDSSKLSMRELDNVFNKHQEASADKGTDAAVKLSKKLDPHYGSTTTSDTLERISKLTGETTPTLTSKVADVIARNPVKTAIVGAGLGYAYEETVPAGIVGALATYAAPKLHGHLKISPEKFETKKAWATMAARKEDLAVVSKQLDLHAQQLAYNVERTLTTPQQTERFIKHIEEGTKYSILDRKQVGKDVDIKQLNEYLSGYKNLLNQLYIRGRAEGLFIKKSAKGNRPFYKTESGVTGIDQFMRNYLPHIIYGKKGKDGVIRNIGLDDKLDEAITQMITNRVTNRFMNSRKLNKSLEKLKNMGYVVEENPARLLNAYTQAMTRTIANKRLIREMTDLDLSFDDKIKMPAVHPTSQLKKLDPNIAKQYSSFDHPALKGLSAHTNVKRMLEDHFEVLRHGSIKDVLEGGLALNNSLKRLYVWLSMFHSQALLMSSMYSLGAVNAIKGLGKKGLGTYGKGWKTKHSWKDLQLGTNSMYEIVNGAVRSGLKVGDTRKETLLNPGGPGQARKLAIDEFIKNKYGEKSGIYRTFSGIDHVTWDYFHDRGKIASYLRHKEILQRKGIDDVAAGRQAARFTNDAYGGLNWDDFVTRLAVYDLEHPNAFRGKISNVLSHTLSPANRKWLNAFLFAPDWTISNIRIIGTTFTDMRFLPKAYIKQALTRGKDKKSREIIEAWKMYGAYTTRAGIHTSALWWLLSDLYSDEAPSMEGLAKFWATGKLKMSENEYLTISKQINEPIKWVSNWNHVLANKLAIVPKTAMEMLLDKQWFIVGDKGQIIGPGLTDSKTGKTRYGEWILGHLFPIAWSPVLNEKLPWKNRAERVLSGFWGFPVHGTPPGE